MRVLRSLKNALIISGLWMNVKRFVEPDYNNDNHWNRVAIGRKFLRGAGIEIGALHNPLEVSESITVQYVDRMSVADLRIHYPELKSQDVVNTDIIDDGERLSTIADQSQDFVIANHFIEHCENPLEALRNMMRVLKEEGVLYLAIPDKRYSFDRGRPITPLDHVIRDYEEGPEWSRRAYFEEWSELVDGKHGSDGQLHTDKLLKMNYSIHFHVWSEIEMIELILALRRQIGIGFDIELFLRNGEECIFVMRKVSDAMSTRDPLVS